jgi:hypothetical protein
LPSLYIYYPLGHSFVRMVVTAGVYQGATYDLATSNIQDLDLDRWRAYTIPLLLR